jgi:hypothetical protein
MRSALTRAYRVLADCLGPSTRRSNTGGDCKGAARCHSQLRQAAMSVIEPLEQRALMSTYYISPAGSDNNNGTSPSSPWHSIGKVSSTHFNPGDSVLFQGGQTFYGSLRLTGDGGSSTDRVLISSYGSGQATINSGTSDGAWSLNSTGITFNNLTFTGTPGDISDQDGVRIENYTSNSVRSGFTVNGCNISGYAGGGIVFGSDGSNEGLNNLAITNNDIYDNVMVGIESYAVTNQTNTNITISNNLVHDNYGDGYSTVTGSGIMLQGVNGAMVEYNSAYNNGIRGGNGGVGIWCYSSNDVIFQYNESYDNYGLKTDDGDGFDFDADTSNSIMQYNYAANNTGGGFQLNQWWNDGKETNDIIRYNISQDNGRKNNYSDIDVWGQVLNSQIYNNTCYNTTAITGQTSDLRISDNVAVGLYASNVRIANNIFVASGNTPIVTVYAAALKGMKNVVFSGNVYYSYTGNPKFDWGSTTYYSFSSWQSGTGEEKSNGSPTGMYANPQLVDPGGATAPSSATDLSSLTAYNLLSDTPILNAGVDLNAILALAVPLTGNSDGKTVPGVDQHLADLIGGSAGGTSSSGSSTGSSGSASGSSGSTTGTSGSSSGVTPGTVGSSNFTGYDIGNPNMGSSSQSGSTYTGERRWDRRQQHARQLPL